MELLIIQTWYSDFCSIKSSSFKIKGETELWEYMLLWDSFTHFGSSVFNMCVQDVNLHVLALFLKNVWCEPFFFKSLLNLLQHCFCFMSCFFGHEACGVLALRPRIKPSHPALEGEVLTTGPSEKSLLFFCKFLKNYIN